MSTVSKPDLLRARIGTKIRILASASQPEVRLTLGSHDIWSSADGTCNAYTYTLLAYGPRLQWYTDIELLAEALDGLKEGK